MAKICKVLIVEDDREIRLLLRNVFVDEGYQLVVAPDGAAARTALETDETIDVVIIDVVLPAGPDGYALATEAAERGHGVILVTADHRQFEHLEKCGHRYLLKPFSTLSLLQLVKDELADTRKKCIQRTARLAANS